MVKLKINRSLFPSESSEDYENIISLMEAVASVSYDSLLFMDKRVNRVLTRAEIATLLDEFINQTIEHMRDPKWTEIIRESLIDHYYRERKEPYTF